MQTITIDQKKYVLVPKEEYDRMERMVNLPALPEAGEDGNYPALRTARIMLARKLIQRRVELGLSQRELAAKAGVRFESISRIETGKVTPTIATVDKLERVFEETAAKQKKQKR